MSEEEDVQKGLEEKFAYLREKIVIKRPRRIFVDVDFDHFGETFEYVVRHLGFSELSAMTGIDDVEKMGVIYHLAREGRIVLNLRTHFSREKPVIKTITEYFPAADIYERELEDLFGIKVEGLPPGHRYPLPDDWPQGEHPLRKDWKKPSELKEERE